MIEVKKGDKTVCRDLSQFVIDKDAKRIVIAYQEWDKPEIGDKSDPVKRNEKIIFEEFETQVVNLKAVEVEKGDYTKEISNFLTSTLTKKLESYIAEI